MRLSLASLFPVVALTVLVAVSPNAYADNVSERRSVTVTATGEVSSIPDRARIFSGVTSEALTAADALSDNSTAMKKVIAGLKEAGVADEDIQTSSFRIEPRYTRPKEGQVAQIDGYRVINQVQVVSRDLSRLGEVLDKLVSLGATDMGGLSFEVSEAETLRDEARKLAVANALRHAKLFAAAAGAEIGQVLLISESTLEVPRRVPMARMMKAEAAPIERGTETLQASVTITWALE